MTKRDELLALAERCEKASEGSRELDGRIWCAVSGLGFVMWDGAGCVYWGKDGIGHIAHDHVKNWSTSLDAAMTLVPEGFKWKCGYSRHVDHVAEVVDYNSHKGTYVAECVSGSRPLALCAAALRAAAEMEG